MDLKYHAEQKHLIYSSGKCGTTTVSTIPNIKVISIDPLTYTHSVNTIHNVIKSKTPIETLTIIIREPRARFNSGLFQTVGKALMYTVLRSAILDNNKDLINHMVNLYYRDDFWYDAVYAFIRPNFNLEHNMNASKEMNIKTYQFHFGNWLTTVSKIIEIAKCYGIKVEIVDTTNLTQYLTDKNYQFTVKNVREYDDIKTDLTTNAVNEIVDTAKAYHAFKKACEYCCLEIITNYLKPEIEMYNKLIAMSKT